MKWNKLGCNMGNESAQIPGSVLVPLLTTLLVVKRKCAASSSDDDCTVDITLETYGGKFRGIKQSWDPESFLEELKCERGSAGRNIATGLMKSEADGASFIMMRFLSLLEALSNIFACSNKTIRMGIGGNVTGQSPPQNNADLTERKLYMFCKANDLPTLSALRMGPTSAFFTNSALGNKNGSRRSFAKWHETSNEVLTLADGHVNDPNCLRQPWIAGM
jgi:hypothetical protein